MNVNVMRATETEVKVREQDRYHEDKSVQVVMLALLCIALTVGILGLMALVRGSAAPLPTYFAAMDNSALFPEKPLDEPGLELSLIHI